jgi:ABC-type transport system involved in cytochrome bd biosynthesis fused ATPase/permease subunit
MTQINDTPEIEVDTKEASQPKLDIKTSTRGSLAQLSNTNSTKIQVQEVSNQVFQVLSDLPDYLTQFFSSYQRPLIVLGLILGALVTFKLTLALLAAINEIPLLAPTFELIGISFTAWFVYRYLLQASSRQEFYQEVEDFKSQFLGKE